MKHNRITTAETQLPSAPILPNPMLAAVLVEIGQHVNQFFFAFVHVG